MSEGVHARAGMPADASDLVDVPKLIRAYYSDDPDPTSPDQRVMFGTSGHRGSSLRKGFNEAHVLAIAEAIVSYRHEAKIDGPLFLGVDTHALSEPARVSVLEVLAAHGVEVRVDAQGGFTPTPVVSHAILRHNRGRRSGFSDGVVITPSHNPPEDGGIKYNPPSGGPADASITAWIESRANALLGDARRRVRRIPYNRACTLSSTRRHEYVSEYVRDLPELIDLDAIRAAKLKLGVDPLGGSGIGYWEPIADTFGLDVTVINPVIDPTFRFMPLDWDGRIRMDCSSPFAMTNLVARKDEFDLVFGNDTDYDRHGIVTPAAGLLAPNAFLAIAVAYAFRNRPGWPISARVGKTVVSTSLLDRIALELGRELYEVPVGFKWFVSPLLEGTCAFAGEESAGASLLRRDGTVWTTDKDGIALDLLAAEATARSGRDLGELYDELTERLGQPSYARTDVPAGAEERAALAGISRRDISAATLAGDAIQSVVTKAPGNGASIGGVKVVSEAGWFAARPSGTEPLYKIYAESFRGSDHLARIQSEAREVVSRALRTA